MRASRTLTLLAGLLAAAPVAARAAEELPVVPPGWKVELVAKAPAIVYPTAIVAAPDGTVYLGQDPMDMPGPPTVPLDSVVAIKDGRRTIFADKLWAVMGLEWADDTLFVVHAPYLSAFRDTDGDGKADRRVDLVTGLGPKLPGFSGINDHVASGVRLGMDGFLYIAVGDKGIPKAVGRDGATIQLHGGGVVRVRTDGTGLAVVSTGERNPLSVALSAGDDVFTYGNDDDSKRWPNSLTHHILKAHFGYPYEFLGAPERTLPIMGGQLGGSGTQGIAYNEAGLPAEYRGNLFFCDWGLQTIFRYKIEPKGATFAIRSKAPFMTAGKLADFRPFSMAVAPDGSSLYVVDWAFNGWLASGPQTGRLYRVTYDGPDKPPVVPRPASDLAALDHPALSVRLAAQRSLAAKADPTALVRRLASPAPEVGRPHALWALDAIGTEPARRAVREALTDRSPAIRLQAARSCGIRRDRAALPALASLLNDPDAPVRREAAIALGLLGDPSAAPALLAAIADADPFVAWSARQALRTLNVWDREALAAALLDPRRQEAALQLCDENWAPPVVESLILALPGAEPSATRAKLVGILAGLYRQYPPWTGNWFGTNPIAGQFPVKIQAWDPSAMARVQAGLTVAASDPSPEVRLQGVAGLIAVGKPALVALRQRLGKEADSTTLAAIIQGLGVLGDFASARAIGQVLGDPARPEAVRTAALDALGRLRGPDAISARLGLVYDPKAPASLVARALPSLGREGLLPANDMVGFFDHADPRVRVAAIRSIKAGRSLPGEVAQAVLARLDDADPEIRAAAIDGVVALKIRAAIPRLVTLALREETRAEAAMALTAMPDPLALPVYLAALDDRSLELRKAAEASLVAIRDHVTPDLVKAASSGKFDGTASLALERVLSRFRPITAWKTIAPFARTTAQVFIGDASIDFGRTHSGAEGRTIAWKARAGDPATGRVVLDEDKEGAGDRGGFGYDTNGSPDLCGFGYAEVESDRDREAMLLIGSSGTITLTVNEKPAFTYRNFSGRAYQPDSDLARVNLVKGKNRILVVTRQGIGSWSFSVQVSEPSTVVFARASKPSSPEAYRDFALSHEGDARSGETLFFDAKGIGCVKCHAAAGKGTASIGPDLTGLALKYDKAEIVRSVLEPSNRIAIGYQPALIATLDGKVLAGLVREETDAHVDLVDAEAKVVRVPKPEIETRKVGDVSIMPAGLQGSLTVVEFADLISYLHSLKSAPTPVPAPTQEKR